MRIAFRSRILLVAILILACATKPRALRFPTLFAVAPGDFRVLYALDEPLQGGLRLLRSVDGGESWKVVNRSLPPNASSFFGSMAVDAADPNTLYIAANPLVVSHDGGASFESTAAPFEAGKLGAVRLWTDLTALDSSTPSRKPAACSRAISSRHPWPATSSSISFSS
ncbi:MAG TPA: hypothetical protein VLB76_05470 [Thermoanaerobaculia bacterium]|jgi:hypothetical protein|nr:hypothetical protein [Thermoanaerobaculia bacterium]